MAQHTTVSTHPCPGWRSRCSPATHSFCSGWASPFERRGIGCRTTVLALLTDSTHSGAEPPFLTPQSPLTSPNPTRPSAHPPTETPPRGVLTALRLNPTISHRELLVGSGRHWHMGSIRHPHRRTPAKVKDRTHTRPVHMRKLRPTKAADLPKVTQLGEGEAYHLDRVRVRVQITTRASQDCPGQTRHGASPSHSTVLGEPGLQPKPKSCHLSPLPTPSAPLPRMGLASVRWSPRRRGSWLSGKTWRMPPLVTQGHRGHTSSTAHSVPCGHPAVFGVGFPEGAHGARQASCLMYLGQRGMGGFT